MFLIQLENILIHLQVQMQIQYLLDLLYMLILPLEEYHLKKPSMPLMIREKMLIHQQSN